MEFYGVLREVIQLMYNSSVQSHRTVVVLRYDLYNLDGTTKSTGIDNDGHYRSVNIKSFWYKDDPFILVTQVRKIFIRRTPPWVKIGGPCRSSNIGICMM